MKTKSPFTALAALGAAIFLAAAPVASAANPIVEAAISAGSVGEQSDGFLGVVSGKNVDSETKRTIDEVNIKRKAVYTRLAAEKGVTIAQVGVVTAEKQIAKLPSGAYYQDASGAWQRK